MSCLYILMVRFTLLFVFLASGTFFLLNDSLAAIGGASVVTPSTPGFNPVSPASNNAYGVYESLGKSVSTGRVGYPSVPVANQSAMSGAAARNAMRGLWRLAGWGAFAGAVVYMGGEFLNYLQCSTNGICKPSTELPPGYTGPQQPQVYEWQMSSGVWTSSKEAACRSRYSYADTNYDQSTQPYHVCGWGSGGWKGGIDTRSVSPYCNSPLILQTGMCVAATGAPVPVTDADLERAADAYRASQPQRFVDDLKAVGRWVPDQHTMSAPQPDVSGAPLIRELPETKAGAPAGNKIEEITPHTAAKVSPDGQSVTVYNYNTTVTTHTDNTTETAVDSQSPDLNIPDDYAREETLDAIRDALTERDATPGDDGCTAQPVCSGDAISCAMLVEQYKGRCAFRNEVIPEESPVPPTETNLNTLVGTLDSGRWAGSAVCPADLTATVNGHVLTIKMDAACSQAAFIKPIVIAAALLMAGMIIMRVE